MSWLKSFSVFVLYLICNFQTWYLLRVDFADSLKGVLSHYQFAQWVHFESHHMWALVAMIAVCLLSWALCITAMVAYFANLVLRLPTPCRKWFMVDIGSGTVSFSTEVISVWPCWFVAACRAGSCSQGCHGTHFTGFSPTFDGTSSHSLSSGNEFNPFTAEGFPIDE